MDKKKKHTITYHTGKLDIFIDQTTNRKVRDKRKRKNIQLHSGILSDKQGASESVPYSLLHQLMHHGIPKCRSILHGQQQQQHVELNNKAVIGYFKEVSQKYQNEEQTVYCHQAKHL